VRSPLTPPESRALALVATALAVFGVYGVLGRVPGTAEYLLTIAVLAGTIAVLRRRPLPGRLADALSVAAIVHLAGGLVPVGDDVLYNASPGWDVLRYDHVAHALAVFCGVQLVWELIIGPATGPSDRARVVVVCALAGLGLGAVNETVEFLTTMARGGGHAGGYVNTGWDLVTNLVAAVAAAVALHRRQNAGAPARR
jgi:putative membrane protein